MQIKRVYLGEIARALAAGSPLNQPCFSGEWQSLPIDALSSLAMAQSGHLSFWTGKTGTKELHSCGASAVLVPADFLPPKSLQGKICWLNHGNPYGAMVKAIQHYVEPALGVTAQAFIHPTAQVHKTAVVEGMVQAWSRIGPQCVIEAGASVGKFCVLDASVVVHRGVEIGDNCHLQAGVVLGSQGFGFYMAENGRLPVPHRAGARLGSGCRLGAQTVVAAGFLEPTELGEGCCTDSLVQIAHNCRLGKNVYLAAQAGLAGSVVVEDGVELGGGAQVAGHVVLGEGCRVAAKAGVTKSVPPGITVAGFPAVEISRWRRSVVQVRNLY